MTDGRHWNLYGGPGRTEGCHYGRSDDGDDYLRLDVQGPSHRGWFNGIHQAVHLHCECCWTQGRRKDACESFVICMQHLKSWLIFGNTIFASYFDCENYFCIIILFNQYYKSITVWNWLHYDKICYLMRIMLLQSQCIYFTPSVIIRSISLVLHFRCQIVIAY